MANKLLEKVADDLTGSILGDDEDCQAFLVILESRLGPMVEDAKDFYERHNYVVDDTVHECRCLCCVHYRDAMKEKP